MPPPRVASRFISSIVYRFVWIAFSSDREGSDAIWRIRADGTAELERLTAPELHAGTPEWSHDGKYIAFVDNELLLPDIFVTSVKHGGAINLTNSPGVLDFEATWSPEPCDDDDESDQD